MSSYKIQIYTLTVCFRYQGYVCPGILVMIAGQSHLECVADAWKRRLLLSPKDSRQALLDKTLNRQFWYILNSKTI